MGALIWSISTPLVPVTVCACAACFVVWAGYKHLVHRVIPRAIDTIAGSE